MPSAGSGRAWAEAGLVTRFLLSGIANTLVGFGLIAGLSLGLRWPPGLANAGGYAGGLLVSYFLSRAFVFGSKRPAKAAAPRFCGAALVAFALNQAVLHGVARALPGGAVGGLAAQACGVAAYSVAMFGLSRWWVFAKPGASTGAAVA